MKATYIFDFDGTLADTFPLVVDITYQLSGGAKRLATKRIESLRRLPLLAAVRALGIRRRYLPRLVLFTRRRMLPHMHTVQPFPGVEEMVRKLHSEGHQLYILSSNKRNNIEAFLESRGLDKYFNGVVSVYYGNIFYKIYGLYKLLHRYGLKRGDCFYVGNEPMDIYSAAKSGVRPIAVTWSGQSRDTLSQAKPFAIMDTPADIVKLARRT